MLTRRNFLQTSRPWQRRRLARAEAHCHHRHHLPAAVARAAHGRPLPGRLSLRRRLAQAGHESGLAVCRSEAGRRPERARAPREFGFEVYPTIAEALRCGGTQAGGGCGADHRRARQLSAQRKGPDPLSALRVLPAVREGVRAGRPGRAGLQRQAPLLQLRKGQGHGGGLAAPAFPDAGRLVASGHLAACRTSTCRWIARSKRR